MVRESCMSATPDFFGLTEVWMMNVSCVMFSSIHKILFQKIRRSNIEATLFPPTLETHKPKLNQLAIEWLFRVISFISRNICRDRFTPKIKKNNSTAFLPSIFSICSQA